MNNDELQTILDSLSPDAREVLRLYCDEDLNIGQIAIKIGDKKTGRIYNTIAPEIYQAFDLSTREKEKFKKIKEIIKEAKRNTAATPPTNNSDSPPDNSQPIEPPLDITIKPPVIQSKWLIGITIVIVLLLLGLIGRSWLIGKVKGFDTTPDSRVALETQAPMTAVAPLFSDNFDSGIKSEWTVINGTPGTVNGEFSSQSDTVWLSLALPPETKNFVVEADLLSAGGCGSPGTIIAPVFVDPNNYIGLFVSGCQQSWKIMTDGKEQTPGLEHENKRGSHFKFVAQNNNITLFIDGVEAGSVYNNLFSQGLIGLYMFKEVRIDNFLVTALP